jgi:hypothetical protein
VTIGAYLRRLLRAWKTHREEASRRDRNHVTREGLLAAVRRQQRERRGLEAPYEGELDLPAEGRKSLWKEWEP